jgi:hypothetical protein
VLEHGKIQGRVLECGKDPSLLKGILKAPRIGSRFAALHRQGMYLHGIDCFSRWEYPFWHSVYQLLFVASLFCDELVCSN